MRPVICSLLLLAPFFCNAVASVSDQGEFNTDFINGKFDDISVTKALNNGLNNKAIYNVSINGKNIGDVYFTRQNSSLTFDEKFYTEALAPRLQGELLKELQQTMSLDLSCENYTVEENPKTSTLSVWFHDTDMRQDEGSTMPLTESINSIMMDYNMSPNYFLNRDDHTSETSLPVNGHLRMGLYGFPVNVDFSSSDVIREGLDVDNFSVSHLLAPIKSEITAGQTYASSRYTEGYHFYGVQMHSVDDLFSRRERYYTPNITGYARTNATVEVYQGERRLYTKTVAAGQFVINEVQGLSNQTLRVVVKEADGTQSTFMYENTVVPGLLTPGSYSYEVNSGKYRYGNNDTGDTFASAEYSYGFNWLTLTANSVLSDSYRNFTLGGSFPLRTFGALGLAASSSRLQQNGTQRSGQSYSINYAKYLNDAFSLQLAGYRYSTKGYLTFNEAMEMKRYGSASYGSLRNRFTASAMFREPLLDNQLSLNMTRSDYWSTTPSSTTYSLSYGGFFRNMNYSLSLAKSYTENFASDTSFALTLTIPFGDTGKSLYSRYNHSRYSSVAEVGLNNYNKDSSWTVSASRDTKGNNTSLNGTYGWNGTQYNTQLSASVASHTTYASGSLNGRLAFADGHFIASNSQADTVALVQSRGTPGATVNGVPLQANGYVLVPLNDQFDEQNVSVDAESLANNIRLDNTLVRIRPRRGEMTKIHFAGKKVRYVRAQLRDREGEPLAFGTELKRLDTGETLFAGNGGGVLLQKAAEPGMSPSSLSLQEAGGACFYHITPRVRANHENDDFIDAGVLSCQNQ